MFHDEGCSSGELKNASWEDVSSNPYTSLPAKNILPIDELFPHVEKLWSIHTAILYKIFNHTGQFLELCKAKDVFRTPCRR